MRFPPGARLGPFEVTSLLGAGGMGEVYRAKDTRLDRFVAIKVLPAEFSSDAGRLKRFEREARSASALNHPNIVTLYEVGREGDTSYFAMELVEGETLRKLLSEGPLPVKKVLAIAAQVADGLARAHAEGIVHRDLKPENIMVRGDGLAKILDFGLAKLTQPEVSAAELTKTPTVSAGTGAGVVMGTVGYMSPEQAVGESADERSDQFSLGAIVYEMATGKRAFERKTAPEILSAIIRDEPEPMAAVSPKAPLQLRWIVERCLAKDPDERYASTQDLARDLATVRHHLSEASGSGPVSPAPAPARRRFVGAWTTAAILVASAGGLFVGQRLGRSPLPSFHRLTYRLGAIGYARFAPDGQTIVYDAAWDGGDHELFSTRLGSPESRSLGLPPASIHSISTSGEMAILLEPPYPGTLARLPLAGGAPRELLRDVTEADWGPDGKNLAVVHQVAGKNRVEYPIGRVLYETSAEVERLRVSPKGDSVAFTETADPSQKVSLVLLDLTGKVRKVASIESLSAALVWAPGSDEVWFSTIRGGETEISAIALSGRRRPLYRLPGDFDFHDVSRAGSMLLEHVTERMEILFSRVGESKPRSLSWLDSSWAVDLSRDGTTLLIDEKAHGAIYLRRTDGSAAIPLGDGSARALSPDGRWVLALKDEVPQRLVLVPTRAGELRELETGAIERFGIASWHPDGKRVVFSANESGRRERLYVQDVGGGAPRPITPEGVRIEEGNPVSPDGRLVVARGDAGWMLYPIDGGEPKAVPGFADEIPVQWSADGGSLYVQAKGEFPARVYRLEVASGRKTLWKEFMPLDRAGVLKSIVRVTPDGSAWAYTYAWHQSDLYLVDGLGR